MYKISKIIFKTAFFVSFFALFSVLHYKYNVYNVSLITIAVESEIVQFKTNNNNIIKNKIILPLN